MVFFAHLTIAIMPAVVTFSSTEINTKYDIALGLSPLAFIWAGNSAVCIFFVLSGFVLSDFCTHSRINFPAQVVRRYFRLALPMLITSAFALLLMLPAFHWGGGQQGFYRSFDAAVGVTRSGWLSMWYRAFDPSFFGMAKEALYGAFVDGKANYNSNLWTMQIELIGSIGIFLVYGLFRNKPLRLLVLAAFIIHSHKDYYFLFAIGVLLYELDATARKMLPAFFPSADIQDKVMLAVLAFGVFLCSFPFVQPDMTAPWHSWFAKSTNAIAWHKFGAVFMVAALLHCRMAQAVFGGAFGRYLGRLSFVLYLVHLPIICSLTAWLALSTLGAPYYVTLLVAGLGTIAAVFAVSTLLYKYVDIYTTSFSRSAGKFVDYWTSGAGDWDAAPAKAGPSVAIATPARPSTIIRLRNRVGRVVTAVAEVLFDVLPPRFSFAIIVYARALRLPGKSVLTRAFLKRAARERARFPDYRFSSSVTRRYPAMAALTLFESRAFAEAIDILAGDARVLASRQVARTLGMSYFETGDFDRSFEALAAWSSNSALAEDDTLAEQLGYLHLIRGNLPEAAELLTFAASKMPHLRRPHQNMAARYDGAYTPTELDLASGVEGRLYDAYNFAGQRVTHVGEGQHSARLYGGALKAQQELRKQFPPISAAMRSFLDKQGLPLEAFRLLPVEWATQIGHIGMMDILFRMRALGWWSGPAAILAPGAMVANSPLLSLFDQDAKILIPGVSMPEHLVPEMVSLQRYCGLTFNAFEMPNHEILPWQDAGAQAMREWDAKSLGYPLRDRFDKQFGDIASLNELISVTKRKWGMGPDDWFVCLHMRDAAHYAEVDGTGQTHRNARLESYLDAIRYITGKGGWVVKLGGRGSAKLPNMERVIDYALSDDKSELLDLYLIRHARFFIGTTSGLTNVAISFGQHCALVNCITTDAQLWSDRVRFAPKTISFTAGGMIPQGALTVAPWRWRMFSAECLSQHGAVARENSSDEILETVKEVEALAEGRSDDYVKTIPDGPQLADRWRDSLVTPYFYGSGSAGLYYVSKHRDEFLRPLES